MSLPPTQSTHGFLKLEGSPFVGIHWIYPGTDPGYPLKPPAPFAAIPRQPLQKALLVLIVAPGPRLLNAATMVSLVFMDNKT